jgi:hypothetical protein
MLKEKRADNDGSSVIKKLLMSKVKNRSENVRCCSV